MDEIIERWKKAILENDTRRVRELFAQHPKLTEHVNDKVFAFDRPAVHYTLPFKVPGSEETKRF